MRSKPVRPREQANRDIEAIMDHYLEEASEKVAFRFIDELERTFARISRNPGIGSPRYAHELDLPDLRFLGMTRYPYLVFYVERDEFVDVCCASCTASATWPLGCMRETAEQRGTSWSRRCGRWIIGRPWRASA